MPRVDGARCLAFEMVGYADSIPAGGDRDISVAAQADLLLVWLDELDIGRAVYPIMATLSARGHDDLQVARESLDVHWEPYARHDGALDVWFARILRDGFAAPAAATFAAFPTLARHHLQVLLDDGPPSEDRVDHIIDGFTQVTAHEDVQPGLHRLRDAGVTVATMTNGTVEVTRGSLHR